MLQTQEALICISFFFLPSYDTKGRHVLHFFLGGFVGRTTLFFPQVIKAKEYVFGNSMEASLRPF